jgi:hypothetical protein
MSTEEQVLPRHVVIIAAAVAAAFEHAEIRSIRPSAWTRQGRMTIQSSHDVSRQRGRSLPDRGGRV